MTKTSDGPIELSPKTMATLRDLARRANGHLHLNEVFNDRVIMALIDEVDRLREIIFLHHGEEAWRPMDTAPRDGTCILAVVDGAVRLVSWGKTSHIPIYGFCIADSGVEDYDLCEPTHWTPFPEPPHAN